MARPTLAALLADCQDIVEFDAALFPHSLPLAPHQRYIFRKMAQARFRFLEGPRAGGKTYTVARFNLVLKVLARRKVVYSGPSYRQAKLPFRIERELIDESPYLRRDLLKEPTENTDKCELILRNGAMSVALPSSFSKIHGERGTDAVFTEFFAYDRDLYFRSFKPYFAVRSPWPIPPLAARLLPALTRGNTLTIETSAGYTYHFSYEVRNEFIRHVAAGDPDYAYVAWDLDTLVEDGWPVERRMIEEDRAFDEDIFQQQYMNRWLSITGSFYELALLMRPELRTGPLLMDARAGKQYAVGFDVAPPIFKGKPGTSACVVLEVDPNPSIPPAVVHIRVWTDGPRTDELAAEVAGLLRRFGASLMVMDLRGGGVNVFERLRLEHGIAERNDPDGLRIVMAAPGSAPALTEAHHALRGAFEDGRIILPAIPETDDDRMLRMYRAVDLGLKQLADLRTSRTAAGFLHFEAPPGRRKDVADALLYAHVAARQLMVPIREVPPSDHLLLAPLRVPAVGVPEEVAALWWRA